MSNDRSSGVSPWVLRRRDQLTLAVLAVAALLGIAGWWIWSGGGQGRLGEWDELPRQSAQYLVDINTADWPELAQLPGIGETLARRIVESRQLNGPFQSHAELLRVRGIGPKTLEKIEPMLAPIEAPSSAP